MADPSIYSQDTQTMFDDFLKMENNHAPGLAPINVSSSTSAYPTTSNSTDYSSQVSQSILSQQHLGYPSNHGDSGFNSQHFGSRSHVSVSADNTHESFLYPNPTLTTRSQDPSLRRGTKRRPGPPTFMRGSGHSGIQMRQLRAENDELKAEINLIHSKLTPLGQVPAMIAEIRNDLSRNREELVKILNSKCSSDAEMLMVIKQLEIKYDDNIKAIKNLIVERMDEFTVAQNKQLQLCNQVEMSIANLKNCHHESPREYLTRVDSRKLPWSPIPARGMASPCPSSISKRYFESTRIVESNEEYLEETKYPNRSLDDFRQPKPRNLLSNVSTSTAMSKRSKRVLLLEVGDNTDSD